MREVAKARIPCKQASIPLESGHPGQQAESGKGDPGKAGPGKGGPGTPDPDKGNLMPVNVECGEAITVDTALAADVGPCPADGIIIAVDGIVTWVTASPSRTPTTTPSRGT